MTFDQYVEEILSVFHDNGVLNSTSIIYKLGFTRKWFDKAVIHEHALPI